MDEPRTAHPSAEKRGLPDLRTPADVAELVGMSLEKLNWWAWILPADKRYRQFQIAKRDGTQRQISAPIAPLKTIQRKLADEFTRPYRAPTHVHGFTPRRSPKTNAAVHVDQRWVFGIDIAGFFPSITHRRVRGLFGAYPFEYPEPVARLLAEICCFGDALPQGAPTSPIISNYICRAMDRELARLAMSHRCYYSRYADDLVFSTDRPVFPTALVIYDDGLAAPSARLQAIINGAGFRINERKTRLQICFQRQRVTGILVNEKVNLSRRYIRGLRALLHIWKRYGREDAALALQRAAPDPNFPRDKPRPRLEQVIRGRIQYVGSVRGWNDPVYLKLAKKLSELDPHFAPPSITLADAIEARLYTEGPTDVRHMRAALEHYHRRGEFLNLKLLIDENSDRGNDQKLLDYCRYLSEFPPEHATVCLFDTDTKIARDAVGPDGWREYGSKVVAVGLAHPSFRNEHEPLCIELLYGDSVLQQEDSEGRRVYRSSEFHPTTSIHDTRKCVVPHAAKKELIAEHVYDVATNASMARSKASFARAIEERPDGFDSLSFEGFRPTLERICSALASLDPADEPPAL